MPNKKQIEEAAKAIHAYELEHGYISREWGGTDIEGVYAEIATVALSAAEPFAVAVEVRLERLEDAVRELNPGLAI